MICIGASVPSPRIPRTRDHHQILRTNSAKIVHIQSLPTRSSVVGMDSSCASSKTLMLTSGASGRVSALFSLGSLRSLLLLFNWFLLFLLVPFRGRTMREKSSSSPEEGEKVGVVVRVPSAMVVRRGAEAKERRAMAIRRLKEIEEEERDDAKLSLRDFLLFSTARGDLLFTQSWTPVGLQTRGLVVLLHGLNEHSGRYNYFAKQLNASGFKVYAMDWIGHGGSDGLHGYVHSLDYAVNDLKAFLEKVLTENPGLPCFCFGHSTGGAIVLKTVLDPKIEARINGVVLTSPAIRVQASHPIVAVVAPIFSLLVPTYQFSAANKKGPPVSRDPEALRAKYSDPLVFTGAIRVRTGNEILRISYFLQQNLNRITVPFLVLHGTADTVTDPTGSQKLYEEASSSDKTIKLCEGFLHDLLFEPERDDISKEIIDWLSSRVDSERRV